MYFSDDPNEPSKSWEWGGFPSVSQTTSPTSEDPMKEEQKSMLSSMFSFMKSKHNAQNRYAEGGIYLSEITSGDVDQEVAEIYFSQKKNQTAEGKYCFEFISLPPHYLMLPLH